jgi:short-subunit dehydrogenase involved in D-alanine esterification of teichoic acids
MNITRAVLPHLRKRGSGTLLYVSSQAAWHADPGASGYCSSKFALEGKYHVILEYPVTNPDQALLNVSLKNSPSSPQV